MSLRERLRWWAGMAGKALILMVVAALSAVTAIRIAIQGQEAEVPSVVGLRAGDAQAALAERGLSMKIADRVFSDKPADHVVRQSPQPGTRVKTLQRTHVVLSLGPQRVSVPVLEGKSLRAARLELLRGGLQLGSVAHVPLPNAEPDFVLQQSPPPRATNAGGPRVNLLVAAPEPDYFYVMPDYTGLSLSEVPGRLNGAGLRLGKVVYVPAGDAPKSTVVTQSPARGARVRAGSAVELRVAE